jgi:hypothetical protein
VGGGVVVRVDVRLRIGIVTFFIDDLINGKAHY